MSAYVNGVPRRLDEVMVPYTDPAVTHGVSVFETLRVDNGSPRALARHLARLTDSCRAMGLAPPDGAQVADEVRRAAADVAAPLAKVRVTITGGGLRIVVAEAADPARLNRPVRAVRGHHRDDPVLPGFVKHGSRASFVLALQRSGVDEVLLVDDFQRFTEGTTSAILAVIDGALWTAPDDGRILASTACAEVLERARMNSVPVLRQGPPADHPWEGLYIASSLRDLCPVIELDRKPLPGWDPIGRLLISS
jgi:branched-chain amino acid aminotransferase